MIILLDLFRTVALIQIASAFKYFWITFNNFPQFILKLEVLSVNWAYGFLVGLFCIVMIIFRLLECHGLIDTLNTAIWILIKRLLIILLLISCFPIDILGVKLGRMEVRLDGFILFVVSYVQEDFLFFGVQLLLLLFNLH